MPTPRLYAAQRDQMPVGGQGKMQVGGQGKMQHSWRTLPQGPPFSMYLNRGGVAHAVLLASCNSGLLANRSVYVGLAGRNAEAGRSSVQAAYIKVLTKSKVIVTCNPDRHEGDSRLAEAVASGALVLADQMIDPPEWAVHGKTVLFYRSHRHMLELATWALRNRQMADTIASQGQAAVFRQVQMADRMVNTILAQRPSLSRPLKLFVAKPDRACRLGSHLTKPATRPAMELEITEQGLAMSNQVALQASGATAEAVLLPLHRINDCCRANYRCLNATLEEQLAEHREKVIVAVDWQDYWNLPPTQNADLDGIGAWFSASDGGAFHSPVLADERRVHVLFKRSRVERSARRLVQYGREVWPINYPIKKTWLRQMGQHSRPRSERLYDVSALFMPGEKQSQLMHRSRAPPHPCARDNPNLEFSRLGFLDL